MELRRILWVLLFGLPLAACAVTDGPYGGRGWELLGERVAEFKVDRDRIEVGRREGRFSALRVAVKGAPLEMYDMVVTFADGNTFSPNIRHRFEENSWSREIDLPGDRRVIRSVDFRYRSIDRREGRATVLLYGR
ncbi:MAG TPA: hypothetical protein VEQ38_08340 [Verrucomicrobiae bacterium]|nr:hypothetical protein [Verrucomicrobiae bacterium]